jgi:hypothetical protein
VAVMLIARWNGDVQSLKEAYDKAHRMIGERGAPSAELRHHCAIGDGALYVIGVWSSEEAVRTRFASSELEEILASVGLPLPDVTILQLHAIEPPL